MLVIQRTDKGFVFRQYYELLETKIKRRIKSRPNIKWARDINKQYMEKKNWKMNIIRCSASSVIREIKIKSIMRLHLIAIRCSKLKYDNAKCLCGTDTEAFIHCLLECKLILLLWRAIDNIW